MAKPLRSFSAPVFSGKNLRLVPTGGYIARQLHQQGQILFLFQLEYAGEMMMKSRLATCMSIFCGAMAMVLCGQSPALAQEDDAKQFQLPAYYKDVVSPQQKDEIYKIKGKYSDKVAELKAQYEQLTKQAKLVRDAIDEMEKDEDAAIEAVLSAEQLAKVKKMYAESQAKRAAAALKAAEEAAAAAAAAAAPNSIGD